MTKEEFFYRLVEYRDPKLAQEAKALLETIIPAASPVPEASGVEELDAEDVALITQRQTIADDALGEVIVLAKDLEVAVRGNQPHAMIVQKAQTITEQVQAVRTALRGEGA